MPRTVQFLTRRSILVALVACLWTAIPNTYARAADADDASAIGPETKLPLPRYVSMKASEGNVRRGPGMTHRVDWVFTRLNLPLQITAEYGNWRRVRDMDGAGGWMHYSLLSGARTVMVTKDYTPLRSLPDVGAGPGEIGDGPPVAGVYVLPDNESSGALEHLLLACAEKAYPTLLAGARAWIAGIDPDDRDIFIDANERKWIKKPSGKPKAIAACIASVLRPGRALQVSIQDNRWLHDDGALDLEIVRRFRQFVERIAGL